MKAPPVSATAPTVAPGPAQVSEDVRELRAPVAPSTWRGGAIHVNGRPVSFLSHWTDDVKRITRVGCEATVEIWDPPETGAQEIDLSDLLGLRIVRSRGVEKATTNGLPVDRGAVEVVANACHIYLPAAGPNGRTAVLVFAGGL